MARALVHLLAFPLPKSLAVASAMPTFFGFALHPKSATNSRTELISVFLKIREAVDSCFIVANSLQETYVYEFRKVLFHTISRFV